VLVVWHARVESAPRARRAARRERALARVERRWDDLPAADAPSSVDLTTAALDPICSAARRCFSGLTGGDPGGSLELRPARAAAERRRLRAAGGWAELAPMDDWREQLPHGIPHATRGSARSRRSWRGQRRIVLRP
jgi:hypothetical protein